MNLIQKLKELWLTWIIYQCPKCGGRLYDYSVKFSICENCGAKF